MNAPNPWFVIACLIILVMLSFFLGYYSGNEPYREIKSCVENAYTDQMLNRCLGGSIPEGYL